VHGEHRRRVDRERTVDEDRDRRDGAGAGERVQIVDDLLRAAHGERRNEHPAAAGRRLAHDGAEALAHVGCRHVVAVAVRRLEDDDVGAARRMGVADDRQPGAPDVAGEHEARCPARLLALEHDARRPENVPRVDERGADAGDDVEWIVVRHGDDVPHELRDVGLRVQRGDVGLAVARQVLGVLRLDVSRIRQHDRAQIARRRRAVDGTAIAVAGEQRKPPGVVDVCVREHHGGEILDAHGDAQVLLVRLAAAPLEQPEVEENRPAADAQDVAGAGHFPGGAEELDFHDRGRSSSGGAALLLAAARPLEDERDPRPVLRHQRRLPAAAAPLVEQVRQRILVVARAAGEPEDHRLVLSHAREVREPCPPSPPPASHPLAGSLASLPATPTSARARRVRLAGTRPMDTSPTFPTLRIVSHPLIQHKLTMLRDRGTPTKIFRELVDEIAMLMAYEATSDLALEAVPVETPLEPTVGERVSGKKLTLVPILRAGLGMVEGIYRLVPGARIGHIGLYRNHDTLEPVDYYFKVRGDAAERDFFLLDPMLATGGSAVAAVSSLKRAGATRIRFLCLVAAPAGVARLCEAHPDVLVYCAALDRELNEQGYIMPGLGDAGDRLFGTR
jgi:uracil phosphoribosyltransferase